MCERNDTPAGESASGNQVYAKFKKQLSEGDFKIKCRKCLVKEGLVLLRKKDVFCGDCLLEYCRHKFRSTIGKSKLLPLVSSDCGQVPKILVAVSGGSASVAMLDMVREVEMEVKETDNVHRTQRYAPAVVHVDESILNSSPEESLSFDLFTFFTSGGNLDLYLTAIELSASPNSNSNFLLISAEDPASIEEKFTRAKEFLTQARENFGSSFLASFNRLQSATSKDDFACRLRQLLLLRLATQNGFDHVFFGSTRTELATGLFAAVSLGRGVEVQTEMAFSDDRFSGSFKTSILRPCREFTAKELAFYVRLRRLDLGGKFVRGSRHSFTTATPTRSAISRLTEAFLGGLAEEFPSTVYTVFNTGNKITSANCDVFEKTDDHSKEERCRFCWAKIDTRFLQARNEYSAFEALQLTSALSLGEDLASNRPSEDLNSSFCYSCLRLSEEMGGEEFARFCLFSR